MVFVLRMRADLGAAATQDFASLRGIMILADEPGLNDSRSRSSLEKPA
jgi:hypothetical protein